MADLRVRISFLMPPLGYAFRREVLAQESRARKRGRPHVEIDANELPVAIPPSKGNSTT